MTREERTKKIWFVQMSRDFFRDIRVKELRKKGGSDALIIYLEVWCEALDTGGVLELKTTMEPAEEIALMINNDAVPMVASVLTLCQACGLITTGDGDDGNMFINFNMTEKFARNWTKEAIEKRANRQAEMIEAVEATALIETTEQPEETEEAKPEKKKKKPAPVRHRYGEYNNVLLSDEEMEKLKAEFPRDYQKRIENLSGYMASTGRSYKNHLATIRNWARMNGETPATKQTTQTQQKPVAQRLIDDRIIFSHKAPDIKKWNSIKEAYNEADRAEAEKIIKNEASKW